MLSLFLLCQGPRLWSSAHKTLPSHTRAIPQHQDRSPALMVEGDPPWGLYHAGVSSQGQLWDHLYPFCQGLRTHSALLWPYRDRTTGFSLPSCRVHTSQCHPSEGLQDWYLWPWHISLPALPKSSPGEAERPEPLRLQQNQMGEKHQGLGKPPQPASQSALFFSPTACTAALAGRCPPYEREGNLHSPTMSRPPSPLQELESEKREMTRDFGNHCRELERARFTCSFFMNERKRLSKQMNQGEPGWVGTSKT